MTEVRHGYLTTAEGIHVPYQWSYATATARAAATGFVSTDVGKLARQIDNNTLWLLTNVTPTWAAVTVGTGLTSTHIPVVGSNGLLTDAANIHRNATSGNLMIGTSTDITGAMLQVAGCVVVSDGSGGVKRWDGSIYSKRTATANTTVAFGATTTLTTFTAPVYASVAAGGTFAICTAVPTSASYYPMIELLGNVGYSTNDEVFRVVMSRYVGGSSLVAFNSIGCPRGSAFLASGDFTVTDDGSTVTFWYTNNEAGTVYLYGNITAIYR